MAAAEWLLVKLVAEQIGADRLLPAWRKGALRSIPREAIAQKALRIGEARLNQVWLEGALPLRGIKVGTDEEINIPSSEAGRFALDCARSRLGCPNGRGGWRLIEYRNVKGRLVDVERPAQEVSTPTPQPTRAGIRRPHAGSMLREGFISPGRRRAYSGIDLSRVDLTGDVAAAPAPQEEAAPAAAPASPNTHVSEQPPDRSASTAKTLLPKYLRGKKVTDAAATLLRKWSERPPGLYVDAMQTEVRTTIKTCSKATVERAIRRLEMLGQWGK
jgi:hypothetical protein